MWGWGRGEAAGSAEPARLPVSRGEWRSLPPIQRAVPEHPLVNPVQRFSGSLASWRSPAFLAPLGHRLATTEPSGMADLARPVTVARAVDMPVATPPRKPRRIPILSRIRDALVQRSVAADQESAPAEPEWLPETGEEPVVPETALDPVVLETAPDPVVPETAPDPVESTAPLTSERAPALPLPPILPERPAPPQVHRAPEERPNVALGAPDAPKATLGRSTGPGAPEVQRAAEGERGLEVRQAPEVVSDSPEMVSDSPEVRAAPDVRQAPQVQRLPDTRAAAEVQRLLPAAGAQRAPETRPTLRVRPVSAVQRMPEFTKAAPVELPTLRLPSVAPTVARMHEPQTSQTSQASQTSSTAPSAPQERQDVDILPPLGSHEPGISGREEPSLPLVGEPGAPLASEPGAPLVRESGTGDEPGVSGAVEPSFPVVGEASAPTAKPVVSRQVEAPAPRRLGLGAPRIPSAQPMPVSHTPDIAAVEAPLAGEVPLEPVQRLDEQAVSFETPPAAELPVARAVDDPEVPIGATFPVAMTLSRLIGDRQPMVGEAHEGSFGGWRLQRQQSPTEAVSPRQGTPQSLPAAPRWTPQAEAISVVQREEREAAPAAEAAPTETPTTVEPAAGVPAPQAATPPAAQAEQNPDELVKKLFDPLLRRLKTELRLDRERRGVLTDRRH